MKYRILTFDFKRFEFILMNGPFNEEEVSIDREPGYIIKASVGVIYYLPSVVTNDEAKRLLKEALIEQYLDRIGTDQKSISKLLKM